MTAARRDVTRGRRIATAVAVIALLTIVARVAGFARTLVFAHAVGATNLGEVYLTANTIPNIIFEIVAGGALAVVVVPLLAAAIADADERATASIASAQLTWAVLVLVPLAGLLALAATPVMSLLTGPHTDPAEIATGARMLRVFAIQLPLYGIGIVLAGVLHAHHRFTWPVLAPLLSSLTMIGAYALFAAVDGAGTTLAGLTPAGEAILSVGTTVGVAVLSGCLVPPVLALKLRLRPTLRLAGELRRAAITLAGAAVLTVAVQQLVTAYLIRLANEGVAGTFVVFSLAQTVFLLPWAVLAVPLSTPTFPMLARAAAIGDQTGFDERLARTVRLVLVAAGLGAAGLIATAGPAGRLLSVLTAGHPPPDRLTAAIVAFAPGLVGYSLLALITRALNAAGEARRAAAAAIIGWAATALAAGGLAAMATPDDRVVALALGNSIGMSVLAAVLIAAVARWRGGRAPAGCGRTLLVSGGAAIVAAGVGALTATVTATWSPSGVVGAAVSGVAAGVVAVAVFGAITWIAAGDDLRHVVAGMARRRRGVAGPDGQPATDRTPPDRSPTDEEVRT